MIGDASYTHVRSFELDGLSELERVEIGMGFNDLWGNLTNGVFRIANCAKLQSIQTGCWSFRDYHSFELTNLPALQSIAIGDCGFRHAPSFSLTGLTIAVNELTDLPQLQSVYLGKEAFRCCHSAVFESNEVNG